MKTKLFTRVGTATLGLAMALSLGVIAGTTATVASAPVVAQAASSVDGPITRAEVLQRAQYWVDHNVVYGTAYDDNDNVISTRTANDSSGRAYRTDCSGLVSMAWHLGNSWTTSDFHTWAGANRLANHEAIQPADAVLFDGHIELFAGWKDPTDHSKDAWSYSLNGPIDKDWAKGPIANSHNQLGTLTYSQIMNNIVLSYKNIIGVTGTASMYGVLGDNRMTFTEIDAASGHRVPGYPVTSTTPLPFTPISMATLNFNTILMNAADGHLYRVDISTNKTSLTFAAGSPTDLGTGWGSLNKLTYDGNGHLYGIIPSTGALRRYDIGADKPVAADITNYTTIATGFGSLQTLTATGPDWLLGSTSAGVLRSYHITSSSTWVGYDLDASGWGSATMLLSPGDGVYYYVNDAHAMYHYLDANPFDGLGTDIQYYTSDPVDPSGWSQVLLSAQPGTV